MDVGNSSDRKSIMTDEEKSFIYIDFESPGNVRATFNMGEVTPLQILAVASYLEYKGKNELQRMEMEAIQKAVQQQIVTPKPGIQTLEN